MPTNQRIPFLDLLLTFTNHHICWQYQPRSNKPVLNYASAHSKLVKRGIATTCLGSAIKKSCPHLASLSFSQQLDRLKNAGFPQTTLISVCEQLVKKIKKVVIHQPQNQTENKFAVIPYVHQVAHGIKKTAGRYGVRVVFSANNSLNKMCNLVNKPRSAGKDTCTMKHKMQFVPCTMGVVYAITLSCGRKYFGQTGRCINVRLREHHTAVKNHASTNLAMHCRTCHCEPMFYETRVIYRNFNQTFREIVEAYHIHINQSACVSQTSVALHDKEVQFLKHVIK